MNIRAEPVAYNTEAEQNILGGLMNNNGLLNDIGSYLEPEHFVNPQHSEIYRTIRDIIVAGKIANPISVKPALSFTTVGTVPVSTYLIKMSVNPASGVVIKDYAELLIDAFLRRSLAETCDTLKYEAGQLGGPTASALIEKAGDAISRLRSSAPERNTTPIDLDEISSDCLQRMSDLMAGNIESCPSTGLADLDRKIEGWQRGRLYVVGGRPAQGKTVFGVFSMRKVASQKRENGTHFGVMYFSLEVPYRDVWSRLASAEVFRSRTRVTYRDIQRGRGLSAVEAENVTVASNRLSKLPIRIVDTSALTVSQIEGLVRETKTRWQRSGQSLDVVFIDYLGLIKASDRYRGAKVNEVAEISAGLLAMAKRLDIAVVALSQLSRGVENRENKIPNMADLRDSGAIEQDANSIIFLHRPAYYASRDGSEVAPGEESKLVLNVDKSRDGSPGLINAFVDVTHNWIEDLSK